MENLARDIDNQINSFIHGLDPVGLPIKFYLLLLIVGFLANIASYILEVNDAIDKERDPLAYPSEYKKDVQFRTYFNICNFKNRLIIGYTIMFCSAYICFGLGFNLSVTTGLSIIAAVFNASVILTLKSRVPVLVGQIIDRIKVN